MATDTRKVGSKTTFYTSNGEDLVALSNAGNMKRVAMPKAYYEDLLSKGVSREQMAMMGRDVYGGQYGNQTNKQAQTANREYLQSQSKKGGGLLKSIAGFALPILGTFLAPGIGTALGSTLSGAALGGIGGAIGGGLGGAVSGDGFGDVIKGAALGGAGGYLGSGGLKSIIGTAPGTSLDVASGVAGAQGATQGSGILGSLGSVGKIAGNAIGSGSGGNPLLTLGNLGASIYSANAGAEAAGNAAAQQSAAADRAIQAQQQALTQVRGDLQPFRDAGASAVGGLTELVNDPNAQASYIQNNPFYQSLADDAKNKLFANQAAEGKVGSGGTAEALQNSLLLLGRDLLNQNITQKQNLATLGSNAAAQTGTATQNAANNVGGLMTQQGNAQAAGTIGGYNATTGAINNAIGTQTALYGIDKGVRL